MWRALDLFLSYLYFQRQRNTNARTAMPKMNIPTRERVMSECSNSEDACQVCMNKMEVFSVGECNHPVCHICSTRMRVLCQRNECAICRQDLPKVWLDNAGVRI